MADDYNEKLIGARDYIKSAFPEHSVSDFAGDEEFRLGVTTRSFRIERDSDSNLITLTHQFFRDARVASIIGRLRSLGVAEAVRAHPELHVLVLRDRVRLVDPAARYRRGLDLSLQHASPTARGEPAAEPDPGVVEEPAVLIGRLRLELRNVQAELKALGNYAMARADAALIGIEQLRSIQRRRQSESENSLSAAASEHERIRAALRECQENVAVLREQVQSTSRDVVTEAHAIAEQTRSRLDEVARSLDEAAAAVRGETLNRIEAVSAAVERLNAERDQLPDEIGRLATVAGRSSAEVVALTERAAHTESELQAVHAALAELPAQLQSTSRHVVAEAHAIAEQTRSRLDEVARSLDEAAAGTRGETLSRIEALSAAVERLNAERDQIPGEVARLAAVVTRLSDRLVALDEQVVSTKGKAREAYGPAGNQAMIAAGKRPAWARATSSRLLLAAAFVGFGIVVGSTMVRQRDAISILFKSITLRRAVGSSLSNQPSGIVPEFGWSFPPALSVETSYAGSPVMLDGTIHLPPPDRLAGESSSNRLICSDSPDLFQPR